MGEMNPELAGAILASARRLGVDPIDLGTAISYETSGTMDPWKKGPTTQWGEHRGLIQWGEPQRAKYGVTEKTSVPDQMKAVENYLTDAGVRPGAGMIDIYSAINAGRVGRPNASDAANGGAPGTVMDKVTNQMGPHRANAAKLLGMDAGMIPQASVPPAAPTAAAGASPPAAAPADDSAFMVQLAAIPKMLQAQQANQQYAPAAPVVDNLRARMAAIAAARQMGQPS